MIVKKLRQKSNWSQEQLAAFSGLSLRTIQRIESGNKVSVESMKSLAAVFEVDITELEQEFMKIDKTSVQWKSNPLWLRAVFWGSNHFWLARRKDAILFEAFIVIVAVTFFAGAIFGPDNKQVGMLAFSLLSVCCAYIWSVLVRLSDKYGVWQQAD